MGAASQYKHFFMRVHQIWGKYNANCKYSELVDVLFGITVRDWRSVTLFIVHFIAFHVFYNSSGARDTRSMAHFVKHQNIIFEITSFSFLSAQYSGLYGWA